SSESGDEFSAGAGRLHCRIGSSESPGPLRRSTPRSSPPYRQLRKRRTYLPRGDSTSLPYRQLRNISQVFSIAAQTSLPYRQLRNDPDGLSAVFFASLPYRQLRKQGHRL